MTAQAWTQTPRETRRRLVDYACYLDDAETIVSAAVEVTVPDPPPDVAFDVQAYIIAPDSKQVALVSMGGQAPQGYKALLLVETSLGQRREVRVDYRVREP